MKNILHIGFTLTVSTLLLTGVANGQEPDNVVCEGVWRTQTQGGWGAPAHGHNPGVYRDAHFDSAFPTGLVIGCDDGYTLTLTSAAAVKAFLPSGGKPRVFDENLLNPTGHEGSFAGNLTALALSVGFDESDADFAPESDFSIADLVIQQGSFTGWTVGTVLAEANLVIGGCANDYSPQQMNSIVDAINNAYDDGDDSNNGLLTCPSNIIIPSIRINSSNPSLTVSPNPSNGIIHIKFHTERNSHTVVQIFDMNGREVATVFDQAALAGQEYQVDYSNLSLPNGIYISKMTNNTEVVAQKIIVSK